MIFPSAYPSVAASSRPEDSITRRTSALLFTLTHRSARDEGREVRSNARLWGRVCRQVCGTSGFRSEDSITRRTSALLFTLTHRSARDEGREVRSNAQLCG